MLNLECCFSCEIRSKEVRACFVLAVLLSGCVANSYYPRGSYSPGPPASVWFQAGLGVGQQCVKSDWETEYTQQQEKIRESLIDAGIEIYEEQIIRGATCRACYQCSAIAGQYYFRINADMEDQVLQLGYSLSEPPPEYR